MTIALVLVAAVLAGVAAWGVTAPYRSGKAITLERLADPLEDERRSLLGALRDLDEERATGDLAEDTYRLLRAETEARAVAVLRALDARDRAGDLRAGLAELRAGPSSGNGDRGPATARRRVLPALAGGAAVALLAVALLLGALRARTPDQPISGAPPIESLSFFEQRVAEYPGDLAARLDLAERYLDAGRADDAIAQFTAALRLDPGNTEAHTRLGFILFRAGRPADGLRAVNFALSIDPAYPEALYAKGAILLRGLHRPAQGADALRAYLRAAPYGAHRDDARALLEEAGRAAG